MKLLNVDGDGNCFFSALALYGGSNLRHRIVSKMQENPKIYEELYKPPYCDQYFIYDMVTADNTVSADNISKRIELMFKNKTWAGFIERFAAAFYFNRNIFELEQNTENSWFWKIFVCETNSDAYDNWHKKEPLFLHFKQQHFQTLSCPTMPKLDHTSKIYFLYQLSKDQPGMFEEVRGHDLPNDHPYRATLEFGNQVGAPVGFLNLKNTCYMNSALQCLFTLTDLRETFIDYSNKSNIAGILNTVTYSLGKLLKDKKKNVSMHNLVPTMKNILDTMSREMEKEVYLMRNQEDPHEFLTDIFQCIVRENAIRNAIAPVLNHSGTFEDFKKTYFENNPCDIFRPITLFTSVVRKYACKHSNKMYQSHSMYELEVDPEISRIQELLNNSITSKNVPGDEGQCPIDHCQKRSRYSIDTYLMELPKYLIVLLKRYIFNLDEGRARKIKNMVKSGSYYPNSNDIRIKVQETQYKLIGMVLHQGSEVTGGHYISYVKNLEEFYNINDSIVRKENKDLVKTSSIYKSRESYILMYEMT